MRGKPYLQIALFSIISQFCAPKNSQEKIASLSKDSLSEIKKNEAKSNETPILYDIPNEFITTQAVNDSSVAIFDTKCVVFVNYSAEELKQFEKSKSEEEWEAFYDDLSYYSNEASLFLYKKTIVESISNEKFIKFKFDNGAEVVIDRAKSVESILFFNPATKLKYCDFKGFDKKRYSGY